MQVRSHICKQKIPSPCCVSLKKRMSDYRNLYSRYTLLCFMLLLGKRDAKIQGTHRVLKKFTGKCHHLLLLPLKYCSSRIKIFIFSQNLVLKNAITTRGSNEINYTADQNNIISNVSNSNLIYYFITSLGIQIGKCG